jgi:hypothetical protein
MAALKRTRSDKRKKDYQRVHKFPEAKGKVIAGVELSVSSDYCIVDISFQDKTALSFDLESCVQVFPEFTNWKSGNSKPLKRWRPVRSV